MNSSRLCAAFLSFTPLACNSSILAPIERNGLNPARIAYFGEGPIVEAPDTARAGVPFEIVITTFGGACIEKGPTNVAGSGLRIDIRPMDAFSSVGANCPDILRYNIHRATVTGSQRGTLEVRVHGTSLSMVGKVTERRTIVSTSLIHID